MSNDIPVSARYDPSGLIGSPSPVNMVVGARSMGKTYGFVKQGVRAWIKRGEQFAYVRRHDSNIKTLTKQGTFFEQHELHDEFPDFKLRQRGRLMEIREKDAPPKARWHLLGPMIPLSGSQSYKSVPLPRCTMLFFDEFIAESGSRYLENEPTQLLGLWESVDRRENRVRIYMAANAADLINPYFIEWRLKLPHKGKTKTYKHGRSSITIQFADDAKFLEASAHTNIGEFTAGTDYEQYALYNNFAQDTVALLSPKPKEAKFRCEIIFGGSHFGVWYDDLEGNWFVTHQVPNLQTRERYVLLRKDLRPNAIMLDRADPVLRIIKRAIMQGFCYFTDVRGRETFLRSMAAIGLR